MKKSLKVVFAVSVFGLSFSAFAKSKTHLGQFDFDHECQKAAKDYDDYEFSPLTGDCYGINN